MNGMEVLEVIGYFGTSYAHPSRPLVVSKPPDRQSGGEGGRMHLCETAKLDSLDREERGEDEKGEIQNHSVW